MVTDEVDGGFDWFCALLDLGADGETEVCCVRDMLCMVEKVTYSYQMVILLGGFASPRV